MLMNIETLSWDPTLCRYFDIPMQILPEIKSSSEIYGNIAVGPLKGIAISGVSYISMYTSENSIYIYVKIFNTLDIFRF